VLFQNAVEHRPREKLAELIRRSGHVPKVLSIGRDEKFVRIERREYAGKVVRWEFVRDV